jgi:Zn-dependent protease
MTLKKEGEPLSKLPPGQQCSTIQPMGTTFLSLIYLIFALIMALTLHEFAHALAGNLLGDDTAHREGRLSLNPLAHIDPVMTVLLPAILIIAHSPVVFGAARPVPFNPWAVRWGKWGAALVAAAGPAMNLVLAVFFSLWLRFIPVGTTLLPLFIAIISINVFFMVFNLIPLPPLDGSRIIYAAVPPIRPLFDQLEHHGIIIIFGLLLIAGPVLIPLISAVASAVLQLLIPGLTGIST